MKLVFIYNADAGLLNGMMDSMHKVMSPSTYACSLCAITHGILRMDPAWKRYLSGLPFETLFLHRDELDAAYPEVKVQLPAILLDRDGVLETLIAASEMNRLKSVDALVEALNTALTPL